MQTPEDVEGALVTYLAPLLGVPVATRIPSPRPDRHVKVSRAGGQRVNLIQERPLLILECWGPDSMAAFDLAAQAWGFLAALDDPVGGVVLSVTDDDLSSPINMPDPDTSSPRYQFTVQPYARLKESA